MKSRLGVWVEAALQAAGASSATGFDLAVRLVDEDESKALNERYRQQDKAYKRIEFSHLTNSMDLPEPSRIRPLGDLVICAPVVAREASQQDKATS